MRASTNQVKTILEGGSRLEDRPAGDTRKKERGINEVRFATTYWSWRCNGLKNQRKTRKSQVRGENDPFSPWIREGTAITCEKRAADIGRPYRAGKDKRGGDIRKKWSSKSTSGRGEKEQVKAL